MPGLDPPFLWSPHRGELRAAVDVNLQGGARSRRGAPVAAGLVSAQKKRLPVITSVHDQPRYGGFNACSSLCDSAPREAARGTPPFGDPLPLDLRGPEPRAMAEVMPWTHARGPQGVWLPLVFRDTSSGSPEPLVRWPAAPGLCVGRN